MGDFFKFFPWGKSLTFMFFVFVSFIFWILQCLQQSFEIEIDIPLVFEKIPNNIILIDSLAGTINVRVFDRGTALLSYSLGKKMQPVFIECSEKDIKNNFLVISKNQIQQELSKQLLATTQIVSYFPSDYSYAIETMQQKEVPISIVGEISLSDAYMFVDTVFVDPPRILIFGSTEALSKCNQIFTEDVHIEEVDVSFKKELKLLVPKNIRVEKDFVELNVDVTAFTERKFSIPILCKSLPQGYQIQFFPSKVDVFYQVAQDKFNEIDASEFEIIFDYQDLIEENRLSVPLVLSKRPSSLRKYRIVPDIMEFIIERNIR
ncbi:hypothetical protein AwDysgo_19130 [Bacteroidales bacterium]|nr:hypothetical protein AwDysgo_19130 [Bacteroidales bacterium]